MPELDPSRIDTIPARSAGAAASRWEAHHGGGGVDRGEVSRRFGGGEQQPGAGLVGEPGDDAGVVILELSPDRERLGKALASVELGGRQRAAEIAQRQRVAAGGTAPRGRRRVDRRGTPTTRCEQLERVVRVRGRSPRRCRARRAVTGRCRAGRRTTSPRLRRRAVGPRTRARAAIRDRASGRRRSSPTWAVPSATVRQQAERGQAHEVRVGGRTERTPERDLDRIALRASAAHRCGAGAGWRNDAVPANASPVSASTPARRRC